MNTMIILSTALGSATWLWLYIWKKDTQKEPTCLLVKAVSWGIAISIPVSIVEGGLEYVLFGEGSKPTNLIRTSALAFVVAALTEESFKLLALWLVLRKNPYFDEHFDGIVYAVCVGLGFAAFENVMYVFGEDDRISTAILRPYLLLYEDA